MFVSYLTFHSVCRISGCCCHAPLTLFIGVKRKNSDCETAKTCLALSIKMLFEPGTICTGEVENKIFSILTVYYAGLLFNFVSGGINNDISNFRFLFDPYLKRCIEFSGIYKT